ncbi:hypothetical protein ACS0TY_003264 [Phlomoides rotata]
MGRGVWDLWQNQSFKRSCSIYINKNKKPFNFTTNLTFADQPSAVGGFVISDTELELCRLNVCSDHGANDVGPFYTVHGQKDQPGQRNLQMFLSVAEPENDASKFKLVQLLWGLKQIHITLKGMVSI